MLSHQEKTAIVGSKWRMKSKFKSIVGETECVTSLLKSRLESFEERLTQLENNNDENFFTTYKQLNEDFDKYQEIIFQTLASLNPSEEIFVESNDCVPQPSTSENHNLNSNQDLDSLTIPSKGAGELDDHQPIVAEAPNLLKNQQSPVSSSISISSLISPSASTSSFLSLEGTQPSFRESNLIQFSPSSLRVKQSESLRSERILDSSSKYAFPPREGIYSDTKEKSELSLLSRRDYRSPSLRSERVEESSSNHEYPPGQQRSHHMSSERSLQTRSCYQPDLNNKSIGFKSETTSQSRQSWKNDVSSEKSYQNISFRQPTPSNVRKENTTSRSLRSENVSQPRQPRRNHGSGKRSYQETSCYQPVDSDFRNVGAMGPSLRSENTSKPRQPRKNHDSSERPNQDTFCYPPVDSDFHNLGVTSPSLRTENTSKPRQPRRNHGSSERLNQETSCYQPVDSDFRNVNTISPSLRSEKTVKSSKCTSPTRQLIRNRGTSERSLTGSSCYQSVYSDFREVNSPALDTCSTAPKSVMDYCDGLCIPPPSVTVPSSLSSTFAHIINPENFWMYLDTNGGVISYPVSEFKQSSSLRHIFEGNFCLAPFQAGSYYYRAKALNDVSGNGDVEVFFVDHGSFQTVPLKELRNLPMDAYKTPMQAINCYLTEIFPNNGIWTHEAIKRFKEFQHNSIEMHAVLKESDKYGVRLFATLSASFSDDYSCDVARVLYLEKFGVLSQNSAKLEDTDLVKKSSQASYDSGVSIASQKSPSDSQKLCYSPKNHEKESGENAVSKYASQSSSIGNDKLQDLISFESTEKVSSLYPLVPEYIPPNHHLASSHSTSSESEAFLENLNLSVPSPVISCVDKGMMIVMVTYIVDPTEFYVNVATPQSSLLDELGDQMNNFYESEKNKTAFISLKHLKEGTCCAARYEATDSWCRVRVLKISTNPRTDKNVYTQCIDGGNKVWMNCSELQPLTPEFAAHEAFSIRCALGGIRPFQQLESSHCDTTPSAWSNASINKFREMVGLERVLTAQLCDGYKEESDLLYVLLWDTDGEDFLINDALAQLKYATYDEDFIEHTKEMHINAKNSIDKLQDWNPMEEEYYSIQNSYGVQTDDFQTAISGYKPNDESYICKYFSLRGYCPRKHCTYEHVELAEGGVTRDQSEEYVLDNVPSLPELSTYVLIQISAVVNPNLFYAILPHGDKCVGNANAMIQDGDETRLMNNEVEALFSSLSQHYSRTPFAENTNVSLACGNIVAAYRDFDNAWHRGRIVEVSDVDGPAKVFFVDFGNQEWVSRKLIRSILPEYLLTPFQAVECHLSDVEPLGIEKGVSWSSTAINCFKKLVSNEVLLAYITDRCGTALHVTLQKTIKNDHRCIGQQLIREGFAQLVTYVTTDKEESRYVPG